ncbi:MAG: SPASM domain-containing protein, partial [Planctomycetota bacterium]
VSYVPTYEREEEKNIFAVGNLRKGVEETKRERLGNFYHEIEKGLHPCKSCLFLPVCGGACPKLWKEGSCPCPSFKFNMKERLMLYYAWQQLKEIEYQEAS